MTTRANSIPTVDDEHVVRQLAAGGSLLVGFYHLDQRPPGPARAEVARLEQELLDLHQHLPERLDVVALNVAQDPVLAQVAGVEDVPAVVAFRALRPVWHHVGDAISGDLVKAMVTAVTAAG